MESLISCVNSALEDVETNEEADRVLAELIKTMTDYVNKFKSVPANRELVKYIPFPGHNNFIELVIKINNRTFKADRFDDNYKIIFPIDLSKISVLDSIEFNIVKQPSIKQITVKDYECQICYNEYADNSTTNNLYICPNCHTKICKHCLLEYIKSNNGRLECPGSSCHSMIDLAIVEKFVSNKDEFSITDWYNTIEFTHDFCHKTIHQEEYKQFIKRMLRLTNKYVKYTKGQEYIENLSRELDHLISYCLCLKETVCATNSFIKSELDHYSINTINEAYTTHDNTIINLSHEPKYNSIRLIHGYKNEVKYVRIVNRLYMLFGVFDKMIDYCEMCDTTTYDMRASSNSANSANPFIDSSTSELLIDDDDDDSDDSENSDIETDNETVNISNLNDTVDTVENNNNNISQQTPLILDPFIDDMTQLNEYIETYSLNKLMDCKSSEFNNLKTSENPMVLLDKLSYIIERINNSISDYKTIKIPIKMLSMLRNGFKKVIDILGIDADSIITFAELTDEHSNYIIHSIIADDEITAYMKKRNYKINYNMDIPFIHKLRELYVKMSDITSEAIGKCMKHNCKGYYDRTLKCQECGYKTCQVCNVSYPDNENHVCLPEDIATYKQIVHTTAKCPWCFNRINRLRGCDDMFCNNCHKEFSYRTGKKIFERRHNPELEDYELRRGIYKTHAFDIDVKDLTEKLYNYAELNTYKSFDYSYEDIINYINLFNNLYESTKLTPLSSKIITNYNNYVMATAFNINNRPSHYGESIFINLLVDGAFMFRSEFKALENWENLYCLMRNIEHSIKSNYEVLYSNLKIISLFLISDEDEDEDSDDDSDDSDNRTHAFPSGVKVAIDNFMVSFNYIVNAYFEYNNTTSRKNKNRHLLEDAETAIYEENTISGRDNGNDDNDDNNTDTDDEDDDED